MRTKRAAKKQRWAPSPRDWAVFLLGILVSVLAVQASRAIQGTATQPLPARSSGVSIAWLPETVTRWNDIINEMAAAYDIDPDLLAIITTIESGGSPKAKSEAGAVGLMQIMPPTASDIAKKFLNTPVATYNLEDPRTNIEFGAAYLAYLRNTFGSASHAPTWDATAELIGAGYNGGPGAANSLERGTGLQDIETVSYARDVYNMWRERHAAQSPTYERWLHRGGESLVAKARTVQP